MQCNRLLNLSKQWYLHVRDETMAPARMVQFIKQHVTGCPICQEDPDIQDEILRITEIILPESKIPKAVRLKQEEEEAERERERRRRRRRKTIRLKPRKAAKKSSEKRTRKTPCLLKNRSIDPAPYSKHLSHP